MEDIYDSPIMRAALGYPQERHFYVLEFCDDRHVEIFTTPEAREKRYEEVKHTYQTQQRKFSIIESSTDA